MTNPTAVPCNAAQLHRFGDLSTEHGPHEWIVQPGMPAVRCPGTAASSAGPAPATDHTDLREQIAEAMRTAPSFDVRPDWTAPGGPLRITARIADLADAVLSVLPAPADRRAVLTEAESAIRTALSNCGYKAEDGCDFCNGVDTALVELRRLADEPDNTPTTTAGAPCRTYSHPADWHDPHEGCVGPNGIGALGSDDCLCPAAAGARQDGAQP